MKKTVTLALLTAVSLILFVVELQIPPLTPFPWVKIGLANMVTLFILYRKDFTAIDAVLVVILRVLLAAVITGSMTSLFFSFCGGTAAILAMLALTKIAPDSNLKPHAAITSVTGALAHNLAQITVAVFMYGGFGVLTYLPALVLSGILSGLLTGFAVTILIKRVRFL